MCKESDRCTLTGMTKKDCSEHGCHKDVSDMCQTTEVPLSESIVWLCTIPYKFMRDGYVWTLLSVKNDFSKPEKETFVHGEYENQYGHIKQFALKEFRT